MSGPFGIILLITVAVILVMFFFGMMSSMGPSGEYVSPQKVAGEMAEVGVKRQIEKILHEDDVLLNNVSIEYQGKIAELDNVIINGNGVFIVEVKHYSGELYGLAEDQYWIKNKFSPGGNLYRKKVKNPIGQVRRQEYILANHLKENGIRIWVTGYAYLVEHNSPVKDDYILDSLDELEMIIHGETGNHLSKSQIERIKKLLMS